MSRTAREIWLVLCAGLFWFGAASAGTGSAKIRWTAPTINTDGSAYTNADGYYVYWATSADKIVRGAGCATTTGCNRANVTSELTLEYTITGLDASSYVAAVSAYAKDGAESALTAIVPFSIAKAVIPSAPGGPTIVTVTVTIP